ncbi:MAG: protoporphyrinogen oxidase [Nitrospirota bacterium]|jgi:oxygen-dependent protoporphyrinogen oxidase
MRIVIAGGGISGLSLAYWLTRSAERELDVTVLEAEHRPGGKIWTEHEGGYLLESALNGFLDNKPRTLELASLLSLEPLRSSEAAKKRFIVLGGKLNMLPESPPAFLTSGLMSVPGKLRIMLEPFIPRSKAEDETLADFARRRLGREAFEKLIDPMASGIYAGNPENMSLASCFPRIREIEQTYGSLIKGLIKITAERKKKVGAAPAGTLTSFREGMQAMSDALAGMLGERLRLGSRVQAVEPAKSGYRLHLSDGTDAEADVAVLAMPAHQAQEVLRGLEPAAAELLGGIGYPPVAVVCTAFKRENVETSLNKFGFLVPFREGRRILGTLFDSSIYPGRAPEGQVLLRTMAGGARAPSIAMLEDGKLLETVLSELKEIAGVKGDPEFVKIFRHDQAIPQYALGHPRRLADIEERMSRHRGLYVTGNALRGVSFNDCIENSYKLAMRILEENA